jgi:hypothetical protein
MPLSKPSRGIQLNRSHPLTRGLVACWLLNENTGSKIFDTSGNGNIGTLKAQTYWEAGLFGSHLHFDGTDDYVDCGANDFGLGQTNEVTVLTWVRRKAGSDYYQAVCQRGQYVYPFGLKIYFSGDYCKAIWTTRTTNTNNLDSQVNLVGLNKWAQYVGTYRDGDQRIYVNGVSRNSAVITGSLGLGNYSTTLGRVPNSGSNWFAGEIDHVMIFNRCLKPEEIIWLYREPFATFDKDTKLTLLFVPSVFSLAGSVNAQSNTSATLSESISSSPLIERNWLTDALFNGMTANAFKLGTTLSLGWFWIRTTGCSVLYRGSRVDEMDFANILTVAGKSCRDISPPDYLPHNNSTTYFYVARRFNSCGYLELTLTAATKVSIDAGGELEKPHPNKVFASITKQTSDNKIRLIWFYNPIEQKSPPKYFNIYYDNRTDQIDYENPLATIDYKGQKFYSYQSDALEAGIYLFAIKPQDANGIENHSLAQLSIQLNTANTEQIEILSAESL